MDPELMRKLLKGSKWDFDGKDVLSMGGRVSGWGKGWEEWLKRGGEDEPGFVIGVDPASEDGEGTVISVRAVKNRGQTPEETKEVEKSGRKRYFGKEIHEMTDDELDATVKLESLNPEDRQELLDEVRLRAMRKGMELAVEIMKREEAKTRDSTTEAEKEAKEKCFREIERILGK